VQDASKSLLRGLAGSSPSDAQKTGVDPLAPDGTQAMRVASSVVIVTLCVFCGPSPSLPAFSGTSRPRLLRIDSGFGSSSSGPARIARCSARTRDSRVTLHHRDRRVGVQELPNAALSFDRDAQGREKLRYRADGFHTWRHTLNHSGGRDGEDAPQTARVNYIQHGTAGAPVVFVHGFGASGFHWRHQIAELGKHHRVYALDLLGFGLSDKPNISYSNEIWGQQVSSFICEVVGEPAVVVGNSLGCIIALQAASRSPSLVKGLVLINTPGNFAQAPPSALPDLPLDTRGLDHVLEGPTKFQKRLVVQGTRTLRRLYRLAVAAATAVSSQNRLQAKAATKKGEGLEGRVNKHAPEDKYSLVSDYDVRRVFALLDADGSGLIDADELQAAMLALGFQVDEPEVRWMMREIDADGNGTIGARSQKYSL
jgi:pimeloyl-ACP methyl ester carboxylesterase